MTTPPTLRTPLLIALVAAALLIPPLAIMALGVAGSSEAAMLVNHEAQDGRSTTWGSPHEREFDFWVGEWDVVNKKRRRDGTWFDESTSRARIQFILGGRAVLEQWIGQDANTLRGFSLRAYDPALARWVVILNWTGGRPSNFGQMEGVYDTDHISIYPPGSVESGQRNLERYTFSKATPESCQWDAQRTRDGGENWQMYWIMEFSRRGDPITTDATNAPIFEVPERPYCQGANFRALDSLIGVWSGDITRRLPEGTERTGTVAMRGTSMIEGCGIQTFIDATWSDGDLYQSFEAASFDQGRNRWITKAVDTDAPGINTWAGSVDGDGQLTLDLQRAGADRRVMLTRVDDDTLRREVMTKSADGEWETVETITVTRQP